MSYHSLRLDDVDNEERLLAEIVSLENKIRRSKETAHVHKIAQEKHFNEVFRPITSVLTKQQRAETTSPQPPSFSKTLSIDEEADDDSTDGEDEEKNVKLEPGQSMYSAVADNIKTRDRDDGVFGLNVRTHKIGDYTWQVVGDRLHVYNKKGQERTVTIDSYDLWRILLNQSTNKIQLRKKNGRYTMAVKKYMQIVKDLGLVDIAMRNKTLANLEKRVKWPLVKNTRTVVGKGFLFTTKRPPFLSKKGRGSSRIANNTMRCRKSKLLHPSVVLIPSNKKQLLRQLLKGVAELRSGNTSMRNIVVPLAQEAKRRKILPPGLLTDREMTWVYA